MKKTGLFLLLILLSIVLFSCTYAKNEYYGNGKLKSVVHMKGGKYSGKSVYYNAEGDLMLECFYTNNLLQGPLIRYYHYNKKKEVDNYDNGNLNGLSTMWYEDGSPMSETIYKNGVLNGPYHEYHPGNRIRIDGQYLQGYFTGKWLYYNFGGDIIGEALFTHGTGKQRSFFPDGKVSHEAFYKNNLKDGEEIEYDSIGKVLSLKVFSHDSLIRVVR